MVPITLEELDLIQLMLSSGMSPASAAEELGIPTTRLYRTLKTHLPTLLTQVRDQRNAELTDLYLHPAPPTHPTHPNTLVPVSALLARFHISPGTLYRILDETSTPRRSSGKHPRRQKQTQLVTTLYASGATISDIRRQTGLSPNTIYDLLPPPSELPRRRGVGAGTQQVAIIQPPAPSAAAAAAATDENG